MTGFRHGVIGAALAGLLAAGIGGGYWWGQRSGPEHAAAVTPAAGAAKSDRKPLYYRNPMGLPDTSPTPKKDPMGMDYVPVYAGEGGDEPATATTANQIRISPDRVQKLGVRVETVQRRSIDRVVRSVGRVEVDERRVFAVAPKFEGWIERLYINTTGQAVVRGQPLFDVYSPELVSAQREYVIATQAIASVKGASGDVQSSMQRLAESSLARLRNWDISDEQLRELVGGGAALRTLSFKSPVTGVVTEKKAVRGMRFMPGEMLYQIADLSSVWVLADVPEQDLAAVKLGAKARVRISAYADRIFEARVAFVYPTLQAETRTVPVRLEMPNPAGLLKPSMFAQVEFAADIGRSTLVVPTSAVIDSGRRQIVLVQQDIGRFEPREVKLGITGSNLVEVLDGVREGETVVVAANFLIDAESNLKAALGSLGHAEHGAAPKGAEDSAATTKSPAGAHRAEGRVESIDAKAGSVTLNHGPVTSLKWPAMTMKFAAANTSLLADLAAGQRIAIEFVERKPGEWVIVKLDRRAPEAKPVPPSSPSPPSTTKAGGQTTN